MSRTTTEPTLDEIRAAVHELLSIQRRPDCGLAGVPRLEDWSEWPEAKRRAYELLREFEGEDPAAPVRAERE